MSNNKKTIFLGLANMNGYWGDPNATPECPAYADIELKNTPKGPVLSISATVYNKHKKGIICCGQCLDTIADTNLGKNKIFQEIYDLWQKYHLNDMHAGTPAQEKALREAVAKRILPASSSYVKQVTYLKSIHLYVDESVLDSNGEGYRYGHSWLYEPISDEDILRIESLLK